MGSPPAIAADAPSALGQRFALDVQGVDALRRAARNSPDAAAKAVATQFEALFMGMLLKSMREATPSAGLFDSSGTQMVRSMLDQQLAQHLSGRGLKLADALYAQLRRAQLPSAEPGGAPPSAPRPANAALPPAPTQARAGKPVAATTAPPTIAAAPAAPVEPAATAPTMRALATHVEAFVDKLGAAARQAAAATGLPEKLILAQAALESAWGRREVRGDDGTASFNLFGIKADASWRGRVVEATTTEVVNGIARKVRAGFRAYRSYEEGFADYARFVSGPRYGAARASADAESAARALQRAGYATDPDYASKLVRVMKTLFP